MTTLDLKELDRLEQAATQGRQYYAHPKRHNPPYFLMRSTGDSSWSGIADYGAEWAEVELSAAARNQLRPLLDLVDDLGEKLEDAATALHGERAHEGRFWDCQRFGCASASVTIKEYRKAKGE